MQSKSEQLRQSKQQRQVSVGWSRRSQFGQGERHHSVMTFLPPKVHYDIVIGQNSILKSQCARLSLTGRSIEIEGIPEALVYV